MLDYSLSLIPNDEYAQKVKELSRNLELNFGEFQPHITLAWSAGELDFTQDIEIELAVKGYYCDIDDEQQLWHGLKVQPTKDLNKIREETISLYGLAEENSRPYFPHITLGCTSVDRLNSISFESLSSLSDINGVHNFTLHFCKNGEHGKVAEVLKNAS